MTNKLVKDLQKRTAAKQRGKFSPSMAAQPEAAGPYTIKDSPFPAINMTTKEAQRPTEDTPFTRNGMLHERWHAAKSPPEGPQAHAPVVSERLQLPITPNMVKAAEEFYVNDWGKATLPVERRREFVAATKDVVVNDIQTENYVRTHIKKKNPAGAPAGWTPPPPDLVEMSEDFVQMLAWNRPGAAKARDKIYQELGESGWIEEMRLWENAAKYITDSISDAGPTPEDRRDAIYKALSDIGVMMSRYEEAKQSDDEQETRRFARRNKPEMVSREATWGDLTINRPPLSVSTALHMRRWTLTDKPGGPVRRASLWRKWDHRVFGKKTKVQAIGILVDLSGSMTWDVQDCLNQLKALPFTTLGVYSGSGSRGELTILADNGRRVSNKDLRKWIYHHVEELGGNVVDGPVLEWLATQAEPRIWVSDGQVTGIGDGNNGSLVRDAFAIVKRAGVTRLMPNDLRKYFKTHR